MIETIRSFPSPNLGICLKNLVEYHVSRHGIVRSLWIELNGSIKAVSPTYRCVTYSRHESELPLCGRIDFTKPEKSSLKFTNSIANNSKIAFFSANFDDFFPDFAPNSRK